MDVIQRLRTASPQLERPATAHPTRTGAWLRSLAGRAKYLTSARTSIAAVLQSGVANILVQGINVFSGMITARVLGPSGRGELAAIIMWPQFLAYMMTLGIPAASVYLIRSDPKNAGGYVGVATLLSIGMGLLSIVTGFIVVPFSLHTYPPEVISLAKWALCTAPLGLLACNAGIQAMAAGAFRRLNFFKVAQPAAVLITLLLVWGARRLNPLTAAVAYLLAGLPILIWNFFWIYRYFKPNLRGLTKLTNALLSYGLRVWGADALITISNQVDRILIVGMLQPRLMGLYVVSQSVAGLLNVIPAAVCTVLMPKAIGLSIREIVNMNGKAVRLTTFGLILAALPLFFFGPFMLRLVYGSKYNGAAPILRILLVEAILDGMSGVFCQAFLAAGAPGIISLFQGCGLLTAVPLMFLLIPRWGLQGAAYALLISTAIRLSSVVLSFPLRLKVWPTTPVLRWSDLSLLGRA